MENKEQKKQVWVRSYSRAFGVSFFKQFLSDALSLWGFLVIASVLLSTVPPFSFVAKWLYQADLIVSYLVFCPLLITVTLLFIKERVEKGVSFWQWIWVLVGYWVEHRKPYTPFTTPPLWKRIVNFITRKEDFY